MKNRRIDTSALARLCMSVLLAASLLSANVAADTGDYEHRWDPTVGQPGTNGPVHALKVFDDSRTAAGLYAGGKFTEAGGVSVNNIARWNGEQWSDVGGGVWGEPDTDPPTGGFVPVRAMAVHDDGSGPALYVAGDFTHAGPQDAPVEAKRIARWDGSSWSAAGAGFDAGRINALASFGGFLYIGGSPLTIAGDAVDSGPLVRWDGAALQAAPGNVSGWVSALLASNGLATDTGKPTLYVGAEQLIAETMNETWLVARFDGSSWSAMTGGSGPYAPRAVAIFAPEGEEEHLYAAAYWDSLHRWTGEQWVQVTGCNVFGGIAHTLGHIEALAAIVDESGSNLYVGGHFEGGCGPSHNVSRWDGEKGHDLLFGAVKFTWENHSNELWGRVHAIAGFDDNGDGVERVFIAGDFHYVAQHSASNIAAAFAVPAPAQKCQPQPVATLTESPPMEESGFGCGLDVHGSSAVIRRCSLVPGTGPNAIPHAVYFYEVIDGEWQDVLMIEDMSLGRVALWDGWAAVRFGGETRMFQRQADEGSTPEWVHVQTIDDDGWSLEMHGPWLLTGGGGEMKAYERDDNDVWVQTGSFTPSQPTSFAHVIDFDGDRALLGLAPQSILVVEYDGEKWVEHSVVQGSWASPRISGDVIAIRQTTQSGLSGVNLYELSDGEWVLLDTVIPLYEVIGYIPWFGQIVLSGDLLIVAADGGDPVSWTPSVLYVFKRFGDRWFFHHKSNLPADATAMALSGGTLMVGSMEAKSGGQDWAGAVVVRDVSDCLPDVPGIPGDLNGDGKVNVEDLLILLAAWGACDDCTPGIPGDCPTDLNNDCNVGVADLLILLANWTG